MIKGRFLRRIIRIGWFHHVTNADVLTQTTSVETLIAAAKVVWSCSQNALEKQLHGFILDWKLNFGKDPETKIQERHGLYVFWRMLQCSPAKTTASHWMKLKRWLWIELLRGKW